MQLTQLSQSPRDPSFVANPYPFYDRARAAGALFHWTDYDLACAISYRAVDALLRDRRFGREAPDCVKVTHPPHLTPFFEIEQHSMLERDPPEQTRLRGQVLRAFTARQVAAMESGIASLAHELIDRFPSGPFDLLPAFAERIPVIVIARMMGVPESMADQLLAWSHDMVAMYQARRDRAVEDAAVAASLEFSAYVRDLMAARRRAPEDDMISALLEVQRTQNALSDPEIVSTLILLLNAGHEATVHSIGNGVAAILCNNVSGPEIYRDAAATLYANCEVLRYDPPLHMFTRYALQDVEVFGHRFREGEEVGLLLAAANRDPEEYTDPHRFDPTRQISTHLSFGAGVHFCVGAPLARLELNTAMPILFERCPELRLAETPEIADRYHFHGYKRLMVEA